MPLTLKTSGLATTASVIVVPNDNGVVTEWVSSSVNSTMTLQDNTGANISGNTVSTTSTWKGVSRHYFETFNNGTFNFYGLRFGTNKPTFATNGSNGLSIFIAFAGSGAGNSGSNGAGAIIADSGDAQILNRNASNKLNWFVASGDRGQGTTTIPTDGTTKFSLGTSYLGTGNPLVQAFYYGLESGSLAADGTAGGLGPIGSSSTLVGVGGWNGQGHWPAKIHAFCVWPTVLSLSDFQSLHTDFIGTLFDVAVTTRAGTNYLQRPHMGVGSQQQYFYGG